MDYTFERGATVRARQLLFVPALLLVGCGFKDEMRGWNIYMARQAIADAKAPIDDAYDTAIEIAETEIRAELPEEPTEEQVAAVEKKLAEKVHRIETDRAMAVEALEDAADRMDLAQRDFPGPKVKKGEEGPQRSKPGAINTQDEYMYNSYSGFVGVRERRREIVEWLKRPFQQVWDLLLLVLTLAPYVLIVLVVIYVLYKLSRLYLVVARIIKVAVPKDKAKEIAAGTPVGKAYDKSKKKDKVLNGHSYVTEPDTERYAAEPPPPPPPKPAPKAAPAPKPAPKPAPAPAPKPAPKPAAAPAKRGPLRSPPPPKRRR